MNRRIVIGVTAIAAIVIFGAAALFYQPAGNKLSTAPLKASSEAPLIRPHAPTFGPADAPVTIVEFMDPACEACRAFHPVVKKILAAFPDKVRVVMRYAAFHPTSKEAILILEAARLQGKFKPVLERLFQAQSRWAPHGRPADSAWTVLEGTGLDIEQAKSDAKMPDFIGIMNMDAADVKAVGVRQTPTFFVNGKLLADFGAQQLHDLVKAEVAAN
jgi:protein-disulfide isomerase